jgi:hypothetical protein
MKKVLLWVSHVRIRDRNGNAQPIWLDTFNVFAESFLATRTFHNPPRALFVRFYEI